MRSAPTRPLLPRLCLALALGAAQACAGFNELPRVRADAGSDRPDGDAARPDATDVTDVTDVADATDAADVTDAPVLDAGPCGGSCPAGQTCCGSRCVDLTSDPANCGSCDVSASRPNASTRCRAGRVEIDVCVPGWGDCDSNANNGCEVDLSSSAFHCGACGAACPMARETSVCDSGRCRIVMCAPGWGNCDGSVANGCEANIQTSTDHCNGCENPCRQNHNGPYCDGPSGCRLGACEPGWADCNADRRDGCETRTDADVSNCGACGHACPPAAGMTPTCADGVCGTAPVACADPRAECDGVVAPAAAQCETDVRTSAAHCGRCGNACSTAHATSACVDRACVLTCATGYGDCDGLTTTGCETDLRTSTGNCGRCGQGCDLAHTAAHACVAGACSPASCDAGFGNCDANPANGCETDTRTSVAHCGACGRACTLPNATAACANSLCAVGGCNAGFADCDHNPATGCEVDTARDPRNCGGCGQGCFPPNATPMCASGRCMIASCYGGFADCNRNPGDGCEVFVGGDPRNCGACGRVCPLRCIGGACVP